MFPAPIGSAASFDVPPALAVGETAISLTLPLHAY